jgi:RNA polymerase sigma factor for flagellar operon FliA
MQTQTAFETSTPATLGTVRTASVDASKHMGLVVKVAKKIARRLPRQVEVDDLVGAGALGLVDAARKFDASRASFEAYAELRIRGAILDYLRGLDFMPRSQRARARRIDEASRDLTAMNGRAPETRELAERTGLTEREVLSGRIVASIVPMDSDALDQLSVDGRTPGEPLERRELRARLSQAIAQLPERTRRLLALYYVDEKTLKEIGTAFGVTESRACQLHSQAISKLRASMIDDVAMAA